MEIKTPPGTVPLFYNFLGEEEGCSVEEMVAEILKQAEKLSANKAR